MPSEGDGRLPDVHDAYVCVHLRGDKMPHHAHEPVPARALELEGRGMFFTPAGQGLYEGH